VRVRFANAAVTSCIWTVAKRTGFKLALPLEELSRCNVFERRAIATGRRLLDRSQNNFEDSSPLCYWSLPTTASSSF
jgi:hypothetical protein